MANVDCSFDIANAKSDEMDAVKLSQHLDIVLSYSLPSRAVTYRKSLAEITNTTKMPLTAPAQDAA
jgi:hypothetical protein